MSLQSKPKGSKKARLSMARLAAVQCVYQWLQAGQSAKEIIEYYEGHFTGLAAEQGQELVTPDKELLSKILQGVQNQVKTLNDVLTSHLNKKDQYIDNNKDFLFRAILYCGAYELMNHSEVDAPLIISEYLHVTRSFYEGGEIKMVNGVLDALKKTLDR